MMLKKALLSAVLASTATLAFAQTTGTTGSISQQNNSTQNRGGTGVLSGVPGAGTGTTATGSNPTGTLQSFSSLDGNSDGSLSRDELKSMKDVTSRFSQLDTDRNGSLSDAEFSQFEASGSASGGGYGAGASAGSDGVSTSTKTPDSKSKASGSTDTKR